jgi:ATP/maltotriose-dependent transcriptional regulator MalT
MVVCVNFEWAEETEVHGGLPCTTQKMPCLLAFSGSCQDCVRHGARALVMILRQPAVNESGRESMAKAGDTRFTERQREVVELIAAGCSNEEIGRRLGISPRTAKAHSDVLRQKLGVRKRRQIPAAYRLLTGDDPLLPDTILRGEVLRRRFDQTDEREPRRPRMTTR